MSTREDSLTLAAAGDAMITRRISSFAHPAFLELIDLVRGADASVVNLEVGLHDYSGYPTGTPTGTYMRAPPTMIDELTWAGFDLFPAAVNHSFDYCYGGMEATMGELEARDVAYAGIGRNLAEARSPAYFDSTGGRVGLVAACATIPTPAMIAGEQRRDMQGRPGISPLRHEPRYVVTPEALERLRGISESLGIEDIKREKAESSYAYLYGSDEEGGFNFLNVNYGPDLVFEAGDEPRIYRQPDPDDVRGITEQIDVADRQADWVVASLHHHEGADGLTGGATVPEFARTFAHACVEAGADVFVAHGSHCLRGVEVYEGAPIFYGLGNFIAQ
ncbi:MAG: CapA family protein, partial [Halobacteriales archaeon]|nr:CapA family protein [Halobacteriales archaeon]